MYPATYRPVLHARNSRLFAGNYVGIIETRKRTVLEILPKVDFVHDDEDKSETKRVFYNMLRSWRGFKSQAVFNETQINAVRRFNMLEVFVHLFLNNLVMLTQRGLARQYHPVEENLPLPPRADSVSSTRSRKCIQSRAFLRSLRPVQRQSTRKID